jgi:HEXXH motif-containing protein
LPLLAHLALLAVPGPEAPSSFGGAAVFDAFGAILINPRMLHDEVTTALSLVHESSHQQMFLFHLDDPVVLNDEQAVYRSPLRKQRRPMEGVFHAMWVSGRMAVAADAILQGPGAGALEEALTRQKASAIASCIDCAGTVAEHGVLSDLGRKLLADVRAAVDGL